MNEALHPLGREHAADEPQEGRAKHERVLGDVRCPPEAGSQDARGHEHPVRPEQSLLVRPPVCRGGLRRRCRRRRRRGPLLSGVCREEAGDAGGGQQRPEEAPHEQNGKTDQDPSLEVLLHQRQLHQGWCEEQRRPLHKERLARLHCIVHSLAGLRLRQPLEEEERRKYAEHATYGLDAQVFQLPAEGHKEGHARETYQGLIVLLYVLEELEEAQ
mmetsp:Transcript_50941/g.147889  ORF Transcript_50941/g.147889 Transcript_50941/m.147889 type:complete len:215 (-) Transcript_50941:730-1374(-)